MKVLGIIPARLSSTRLPGKLLLQETGKPLIQHTWEAVTGSQLLDEIVIATDSPEIAAAAAQFGARVVQTGECANGTERAAEAIKRLGEAWDLVVNIQGDEPEIDPSHIDVCIQSLQKHPECEMATLANPLLNYAQLLDPGCVKVVRATNGQALYFSRAPIPHSRDLPAELWLEESHPYQQPPWLQHIGLYAYRVPFVQAFAQMPPSPLEAIEQLEQLRALQAGAAIHVAVVTHRATGIDTPQDYRDFVRRFQESAG